MNKPRFRLFSMERLIGSYGRTSVADFVWELNGVSLWRGCYGIQRLADKEYAYNCPT